MTGNARVVFHHVIGFVIWTSGRVVQTALYPLLGHDQFRMSHTSRTNLETPALKLVLGIYLAKVLPSRGLAVTGRCRLRRQP
jgi:hypothetical protein